MPRKNTCKVPVIAVDLTQSVPTNDISDVGYDEGSRRYLLPMLD